MTLNPYRMAVAVVCMSAVLAGPVLLIGSTFTRAAFVVALAGASCLIYRHGRKGDPR